jgi:hypothetical protein
LVELVGDALGFGVEVAGGVDALGVAAGVLCVGLCVGLCAGVFVGLCGVVLLGVGLIIDGGVVVGTVAVESGCGMGWTATCWPGSLLMQAVRARTPVIAHPTNNPWRFIAPPSRSLSPLSTRTPGLS